METKNLYVKISCALVILILLGVAAGVLIPFRCAECSGHGLHDCGKCEGQGKVECSNCKGKAAVDCTECNGTGTAITQDFCSDCGGSGKIRAPKCGLCEGDGTYNLTIPPKFDRKTGKYIDQVCFLCEGSGRSGEDERCTSCIKGRVAKGVLCDNCESTGSEPCMGCYARGEVTCPDCKGIGESTCKECFGKGRLRIYERLE